MLLAIAALMAACGPARPPATGAAPGPAGTAPNQMPPAEAAKPIDASTRLTTLAVRERPELDAELRAERVTGTIALFDSNENVLVCSNAERCRRGHLPASTFKIPNSVIALETGTVSDPEAVLKWDGVTRRVPDWNQDLTLRRAVQVSCLPCFQGIARSIGEARMREWVTRLEYGNQDVSGGIDRFWMWGGLKISPIEQLDFLRRLDLGKLKVSERVRDTVIDLITLDVANDYVLRGKTGLALKPEEPETIGWFVGWVERGPRHVYFATALEAFEPDVDLIQVRRRVTERVLAHLGILPS